MAKKIWVAYLLWLFGGWLGLHLFYLGRDRHGLVWMLTWGGCMGVGCLRDLCRIPSYVEYANGESSYRSSSTVRIIGEIIVGVTLGVIVRAAIPEEYDSLLVIKHLWNVKIMDLILPAAVAIGVHLVANIEPGKCKLTPPLIGAYLAAPLMIKDSNNVTYVAIFSVIAAHWKGYSTSPQASKKKRGFCKRLFIIILAVGVYNGLWLSSLAHNTYVTTSYGERVKLKDAMKNFFDSPAWVKMKETGAELWNYYQEHGFAKLYEEFVKAIDPEGETSSYNTLGLPSGASQDEIKHTCRKLQKEWHPDKHRTQEMKDTAQERFMKIQTACNKLSTIWNKRNLKRNRRN